MKNRTIGILLGIISVVFVKLETVYFGNNWTPQSTAELVCKVYIHEAKASNFSHLLNKGTYPEFRLDPRNVRLHCERCHNLWHKHGPEALQWSTGWTKVCATYFALRDAARGIT